MALKDTVVYRVHLFHDVRLKIFLAALAANAGGDVAHDHQMFLAAIVVVDSLLDDFSPAIRAIRVTVHDRPPLVLGSLHFGAVVRLRCIGGFRPESRSGRLLLRI